MQYITPTNNEIFFEDSILITEFDLEGIITYANRKFLLLSGYTNKELIGKPHTFMRHPDMPQTECDKMWYSLKKGYPWNGYIKNLTKDGSFYWVHVFITPRFDSNGKINGYISTREAPSKLRLEEIKRDYELLRKSENHSNAA